MSDRENLRLDFLKTAGLGDAVRARLPGDASTRRYERLTPATGPTLMLMDQAPAAESPPCDPSWTPDQRRASGWNAVARLSAGRIEAFAAVAAHLRSVGLSAPDIPALDAASGLAVLEDFGDALFALVIADGADETPLYLAAIEALAVLHAAGDPPATLHGPGGDWPLLTYDETALQGGADLFVDWLPKLDDRVRFDAAAIADWRAAWAPSVASGAAGASVMAHRDYHAENLIWLPRRDGAARVGMIDFQDAVRAHPSWDLHSLLQDARRDVSPELETAMLDRFLAARPSLDREAFIADYRALAASNAARILGRVFARQALLGRTQYEEFMPRTWRYLERNLADPQMAELKAWFDRHIPQSARR